MAKTKFFVPDKESKERAEKSRDEQKLEVFTGIVDGEIKPKIFTGIVQMVEDKGAEAHRGRRYLVTISHH
jgi:hypothetical protein